jgi:hypothetical protein
MHSAISNDTLIMNTGLTFGDNTSPSNWEPIARARQQLAQHLWHQHDIIERGRKYLPEITFEPPATPTERAQFTRAIQDSLNPGVIDTNGKRISPRYNHHVDDNMYGDISENMERTAAASIVSLYEIAGYPDGRFPTQSHGRNLKQHTATHGGLSGGSSILEPFHSNSPPTNEQRWLSNLQHGSINRIALCLKLPNSMGNLQTHPEQTEKVAPFSLLSRTRFDEPCNRDSIKLEGITVGKTSASNCKCNYQGIFMRESTQ